MDTDIISGIESGIATVLVLSGVARRDDLARYGFSPDFILDHVGQLPALLEPAAAAAV
jgi:NagD protein